MTNDLFQPVLPNNNDVEAAKAAVECVHAFTNSFNARDLLRMDSYLHFPHVILSGEQLTVWHEPGEMPATFFQELHRDTGWTETRYQNIDVVLVSPRKVHLVVIYTRNRKDGSVASSHSNLWIVTFDDQRWGIKQRSY